MPTAPTNPEIKRIRIVKIAFAQSTGNNLSVSADNYNHYAHSFIVLIAEK